MGDKIIKAIHLIKEGRWFEGVILILMVIGVIYFVYWWNTGRWESKGKCSSCRGVGTIVRRNGRIDTCLQCRGIGKPNGKEGLRFPPKTKRSKKEVEIDFSQRILCSDGYCIGVINEQGVCNTCGKPYTGMAGNEKCLNHPQKNAVSFCISCKRYFCEDCLTKVLDFYCCGSEICIIFIEKKAKQAKHNVIASGARSLADETINLIDGGLTSQKTFDIAAIYIEIIFVFFHDLMDIASQYLDEEEKLIFMGEIYVGIRDVLAKRYSAQIDIGEFHVCFDDTFKERRMEYLNFVGLNPSSWSEDLLYMSFGRKIANILAKEVDLETDANIQTLYITASLPIMLVKKHLEKIKELKKQISIISLSAKSET